ncbi:hypothetical protein PILCRDRAFT_560715 [Piloderma croceum F 1598]|uniref:Uncharacterized protein n=1 Tax=Piloderma croceum (strain F 1598) TaxID=765440 RepID=A0A0C3FHJ0_PILCF|nr:hypothetical protein PILCRDRAFT_560715 [Piloderma croceum F 1598]
MTPQGAHLKSSEALEVVVIPVQRMPTKIGQNEPGTCQAPYRGSVHRRPMDSTLRLHSTYSETLNKNPEIYSTHESPKSRHTLQTCQKICPAQ